MDFETTQVAARYFVKLAMFREIGMFRQQRGTTASSTDRRGNYHIQADFGGDPEKTTTAQVAVRQAVRLPMAGNSEGRQQLSRANSLIMESHGEAITFSPGRMLSVWAVFFVFCFSAVFRCLFRSR